MPEYSWMKEQSQAGSIRLVAGSMLRAVDEGNAAHRERSTDGESPWSSIEMISASVGRRV